jgi:hypothetical protein
MVREEVSHAKQSPVTIRRVTAVRGAVFPLFHDLLFEP